MEQGESTNSDPNSNNSSLNLSITPPICDETASTISEHIENDRSLHEIEIDNLSVLNLSQEPKPASLNSSFNSNSIISLNGLDRFIVDNLEGRNNVTNILEGLISENKSSNKSSDSFDIFANVDLNDKSINNGFEEATKRVKDFEELLAIKDTAIAQLTNELDSYKELMSYSSSSTTEYRQFQDESPKLVEFHNAIVHKDDQIEKLTQSLQQSVLNREEMKQHFKNELFQLQDELRKTSDLLKIQRKVEECPSSPRKTTNEFYNELVELLGAERVSLVDKFQMAIQEQASEANKCLEEEVSALKRRMEDDRLEFDGEMNRLKSLLSTSEGREELNEKHSKEMEELRTYFEQKCADLEKNYSEEVFSQHSRKLSGSSTSSEAELSPDFCFDKPGPGGDSFPTDYTKSDLQRIKNDLAAISLIYTKFKDDYDAIRTELHKYDFRNIFKLDLSFIKNEIKAKYIADLHEIRQNFDSINAENERKVQQLQVEVAELRKELSGRIVQATNVQEVSNSGEFEIDEVVQSYERRLQEQIALAKFDIINALEAQIQKLAAADSLDEEWPEELLQLKSRFSHAYEQKIVDLQTAHESQLQQLKDEHKKAVEKVKRRDSLNKTDLELLNERDNYKKQTISLRNLLGELLKYFTQCEDELNNTIVEELLNKQRFTEDDESDESITKRVHLTPHFTELIDIIDNENQSFNCIDLKSELGTCLENLKLEANAILSLTNTLSVNQIQPSKNSKKIQTELNSLTRKLINETQLKNELIEELTEAKAFIQSLENDRIMFENQADCVLERQKNLERDLGRAREKIAELIENGHREIISEGYGDQGGGTSRGMVEVVKSLVELREQARGLLEKENLDPSLVSLIEDLLKVAERIVEEAKKDQEDLKQQIEAADKKYKATCKFLEEQATEREQERDEAQKEINRMKGLLKSRDKDRASFEHYSNEVEALESQLQAMKNQLQTKIQHCKQTEVEQIESHEKIQELREIIRDLEDQIKNRTQTEDELKAIIEELEVYVRQQVNESEKRLKEPNESLHKYVANLEAEIQQLRLNTEIAGSEGVFRQIKNQILEIETTIDQKTKELEAFHTISTCSSASEDFSMQQNQSALDECEIPLQQLTRLKEKLVRHSRAEDAALKRIRDLEMEMTNLKDDLDENLTEKEMLKKQTSDHLVLISNLQIRLDEQRIRAEHIEKQTNTSLEVQNYDLKTALNNLEEKLTKKDKLLAQLKADIVETKTHLAQREEELVQVQQQEPELLVDMQRELDVCRKELLKYKENSTLDSKEMEALSKLRNSGVSFQEMFNFSEMEHMRRASSRYEDTMVASELFNRNKNETVFTGPEISAIEPKSFASLQVTNKTSDKHVRFQDEVEVDHLKEELQLKNQLIEDYEAKLQLLEDLEEKIDHLQTNLIETEQSLVKATQTFEFEQQKCKNTEDKLSKELAKKTKEWFDICEQNKLLDEQLQQSENKIKVLENKFETSETTCKDLKNTLNQANQNFESLKEEKNTISYKLTAAYEELELKSKEKVSLTTKLDEMKRLQHLVEEKDKIIAQMSEDSRSLRENLETIQLKLQETGNIVDLGRRLCDEQKKNFELTSELHRLKAQLLIFDRQEIDEVAGQIQRELDYSAQLDSSLLNALDSSIESQDLDALKLALKKQKSVNRHLGKAKEQVEIKCEDFENKFKELIQRNENLKTELETVRVQLRNIQQEDAELIKQLKKKVDNASDKEGNLKKWLEKEQKDRKRLENEVATFRSLPEINIEASDIFLLKRENKLLDDEVKEVKKEVKKLNNKNLEFLAEVARLNGLLSVKSDEINQLETKIRISLQTEDFLNKKIKSYKSELEEKRQIVDLLNHRLNERNNDESLPLPDKLMGKIRDLRGAVNDNMQMIDIIKKLNNEKRELEERLSTLQNQTSTTINLPFDDPSARANYLFAKFLRSESYRKALIWQKRYMISLLETYQSHPTTNPLLTDEMLPKKSTGKKRFKRVVLLIVAVERMKYLVKRWHSGKRIVQQRNNQRAQFQVGQPVSSQALAPSALGTPWSGLSPPCKDRGPLLQSPGLLNRYVERFNEIQDKLGFDSCGDAQ